MTDKKTYKDTLNLPKTNFDMRAGLLKKEPAIQQQWKDRDVYARMLECNADGPSFVLHDGPPYANGNIHMGHALNKTLKDMVFRVKAMTGHRVAPLIHGWDCHGLPIEQKVLDDLGEKARDLPAMDIRQTCRTYAEKFVAVQSEQFQRLGVVGEFDEPYITMKPAYEAAVLEVFARLIEQGVVFKQLKPVHWSIENRTALADAELEYHDREDPSIYVAFEVVQGAENLPHYPDDRVALAIWTTTPWTLPANRAVAVHPKYSYAAVHVETPSVESMTLYVAANRLEAVLQAADGKLKCKKVLGEVTGQQILDAHLAYRHPLDPELSCPLVAAEYVTLEDGTGLVHTAPGHGVEDYHTGLANGLEIACPVDADGLFDASAPDWLSEKSVWEGTGLVVEHLRQAGTLLADVMISHSYPHDWRSKTPTIFRATEQWFIGVDRERASGGTLRAAALDATAQDASSGGVDFIPAWGRNRMRGMIESRPDWCISRQRAWGLPIPAFYDPEGRVLCTAASVRAVASVIAREGSDAWFTRRPAELLEGYDPADDPAVNADDAPAFAPDRLEKGFDIFDVWFESGSSWFAVAMRRGLIDAPPVDMYLEGSDQHRGWFQLSLLPALGCYAVPPFRSVLTHGFVVTEDGHKMSKSLGNAIEPTEQLQQRGADILRLWIASQNYQDDVHCGEDLIAQSEDAYRKLRNTLRFCLGAIGDFHPEDASEPSEHSIDLWMRLELQQLIRDVREAYDRYEFHRATRLIYEFCTVQASSVYLSAIKDRLYCEAPDSPRRRATQTVLREIVTTLVKLLAPIIPHTAEEAWAHIPHQPENAPDSVHLAPLPEVDREVLRLIEDFQPVAIDDLAAKGNELRPGPAWVWEKLMDIRGEALAKIEALRQTGLKNPLDAEVVFHVPEDKPGLADFLQQYLTELEDALGVGYARIETGPVESESLVEIEALDARENYPRCERSWKRRPDVGADPDYPDVSARDAAVLKSLDA